MFETFLAPLRPLKIFHRHFSTNLKRFSPPKICTKTKVFFSSRGSAGVATLSKIMNILLEVNLLTIAKRLNNSVQCELMHDHFIYRKASLVLIMLLYHELMMIISVIMIIRRLTRLRSLSKESHQNKQGFSALPNPRNRSERSGGTLKKARTSWR